MKTTDITHILTTENLSIGYRQKKENIPVAGNINVQVEKGKLTAVIGINGVGKSTFLRTLSGVQPPLEGKVLIQGVDRKALAHTDLAEKISLVLTRQPISMNLRVAELIALGRQPYTNWLGSLSANDHRSIEQAIDQVRIGPLREKKCFELSDGQLQKVLIARALAQDTPIMILDEPTSHLDMYHKAQVITLLHKLSKETGKAIIFATHEINVALQLCDNLILMTPQRVIQGAPEELVRMNVLPAIFPSDLIVFDPHSKSFRIKT